MAYTTQAEFDEALTTVRATFASGRTKSKSWRRQQLKRLWWMLEDHRPAILAALRADLHKSTEESTLVEIGIMQTDILYTLKKLDEWTADEKPTRLDPINLLGGTVVRTEPLGVTLIIGAWNCPVQLALQPLIGAIAAGCAAIVKPSDVAVAAQDVLTKIIPEYLDGDAIRCVTAGPKEMEYILQQRFDHIFYTGSAKVAKIVHAAAAKHLTPVVLELGGQGPAIVCEGVEVEKVAKRIAGTKFFLAGQVCISVNHILVHPSIRDALVTSLIHWFDTFNGGRDVIPEYSCHIVNERNFDRLESLLARTSGTVVYGGVRDRSTRYFGPTIVVGVQPDDVLLTEEIFGPILPVIDADLDAALAFTTSLEHPLALYAFTNAQAEKDRILQETTSGGVTFNDCLLHALARDTPFGGVGQAGMGSYHGKYGIQAFSYRRTVTNAMPAIMEGALEARYPPYTIEKMNKMAPHVMAPFDREGNEKMSVGKVIGAVGAVAALGASVWFARDRIPGYVRGWMR
ncbi:aldehyde dehydrogenase [Aspergillus saccharolyticus JOP 1030-1]|uniref:Aldehyde dehydrogenase n=1 Tax=Aspergillus saccharolyticus JOP 1030-1 TaxID=1450539 RepID=A0A318ZFW3_9EURO|nr:aldehyde dehydrogenase [Aspergillus saccharolyticus JOP 1030-1]PYH45955.1 aldehyde dehydrogenase [Aspergillus saccharolyticus JOP 1030-1]